MNVPMLREIQEKILTHPELFYMGDFHKETACGTAHCIGGWAKVLGGGEHGYGTERIAREVLNITGDEGDRLFYVTPDEDGEGWPIQFHGSPDAWEPTPQQAVDRIEHFIKTEGRE